MSSNYNSNANTSAVSSAAGSSQGKNETLYSPLAQWLAQPAKNDPWSAQAVRNTTDQGNQSFTAPVTAPARDGDCWSTMAVKGGGRGKKSSHTQWAVEPDCLQHFDLQLALSCHFLLALQTWMLLPEHLYLPGLQDWFGGGLSPLSSPFYLAASSTGASCWTDVAKTAGARARAAARW
ncbi:hypothetical protein GGTG_11317 [Gaeumannomyces tritici R3-111a-1]|uniref:Uncharacterized protein n=1 Tax=Gaeumannomyces tritici (strain R3-111a-1) TaxID=644352 RepID=J3PCU8_GAET3|nr:hypothetical protein GGTG_11317 [Gaeumannomyces tritici R3-111a-1]EJT72069.1 hypothetical protein GGTG_11317 [Gaeumannomyces tritici R3-111a-1]